MGVPIVQVDAFTDRPYHGNPAAVCVLGAPADEAWMQDVAREMNLSETAYLWPERSSDAGSSIGARPEADGFRLRWFTPSVEVDLCGHATVASAHVLWETGVLAPSATARFHTRSGLLTATRRGTWIELDFPAKPVEPTSAPPGLLEALGVIPRYVGRNRFDYLVEVESEEIVRKVVPDHGRLRTVQARGVMVTSPGATPEHDFVSRFFAPGSGIDEDPVTGSSHCALGPYWGPRLGKTEMVAYQASARGGTVRVRLAGDRVVLGGQAVTVLRGELVGGTGVPAVASTSAASA
jgi:PhzF family phenazine biosynthesis protein